jgi:hypothetical protein
MFRGIIHGFRRGHFGLQWLHFLCFFCLFWHVCF